jgi:hypothetical protein
VLQHVRKWYVKGTLGADTTDLAPFQHLLCQPAACRQVATCVAECRAATAASGAGLTCTLCRLSLLL